MKNLYRSKANRVIAGLCGGIGEYIDIDPVLIRVLWTIVVILSGIFPGVILYLVLMFIVPEAR